MSRCLRVIPLFAVALFFVAPAQAKTKPVAPKAPTGLHAFLLRSDEPAADTFARTPSFAWHPVAAAKRYEVELSTSSAFAESSEVWSGSVNGTPAISVPLALPWTTGKPYALYARVRTVTSKGLSRWSQSFGFNMRPPDAPLQVSTYPGLVHWSSVPGATSYQVWWVDIGKQIGSLTNYADEREFYSFHQLAPWPTVVHWRVRAVRAVYGSLPNGMPVVAYGPWSTIYTSLNPQFGTGPLTVSSTVSDTVDANGNVDASVPHTHTPAFLFAGNGSLAHRASELYRVYVFSDKDCVNLVFRGAVVGSPAYSPRPTGPLALPGDATSLAKARVAYLADGSEGKTYLADLAPVTTSETVEAATSAPPSSSPPASTPAPSAGAPVDLWDSGWPSGRYYWTVLPVNMVPASDGNGFAYRDAELPEEACAVGRVGSFGKLSDPVLVADHATQAYTSNAPFASGLSTDGKLVAAARPKPVFYGTPLVAWLPAIGAASYEVQWSSSLYPWKKAGSVATSGTSTLVEQGGKGPSPGTWYYRVRGLDPFIPGSVKQMTWSDPVQIIVAKPQYRIVRSFNL